MFFEKYKSHYSLNFFAACGWVNLIGLLLFLISSLINSDKSGSLVTFTISLNWFFVVYATVTFFIFMLENFYEFKITNTKFLNNKFINIMRILGTLLAAIPFISLIAAFLFLKF